MRQITLVSTDAGPGHNCGLALGLEKYGKLTVVWENKNPHGLDYFYKAKYGYRHIPKYGDDLVVVGALCFDRIRNMSLQYNRKHIVITDGRFARYPEKYNHLLRGWDVITTACKRHFREPLPVKTYYQPFDLSHIDSTKNKVLTVGHSPFGEMKFREKGTEHIIETCADLGVNLDLITGVSWQQCLKRKAKCHIFVDQIDHYDRHKFKIRSGYVWPALGKSGLEALHLGCCVITYGKGYDTDIPAPPVAWCRDNFRAVLEICIKNEKERNELSKAGKAWALQFANYEFAAEQVLK